MNEEELALFLGMMCGDGHLSLHHKKRKYGTYYDYYTGFCNTDESIMNLFDKLFFELFGVKGHFYPRDRENRKRIYEFHSYSKEVFDKISSLGFPVGVKKDILRIPKFILKGSEEDRLNFFFGVLITDGCLRRDNTIIFHSGSQKFLEDLSLLLGGLIGVKKEIKSFVQKGKYMSYQLNLNKQETRKILSMPPSHSGSAPVLSLKKFRLVV